MSVFYELYMSWLTLTLINLFQQAPIRMQTPQTTIVTWEQYSKHIFPHDCWELIEGFVYNVSNFIVEHPGGDEILVAYSGTDATFKFNSVPHSEYAKSLRNARLVGKIETQQPPIGYLDMLKDKKSKGKSKLNKIIVRTQPISREEIALHKTEQNCWIIIEEKVYDVTTYLNVHPGGIGQIMQFAGGDATKGFSDQGHSKSAYEMKNAFYIGEAEKQSSKLFLLLILIAFVVGLGVYYMSTA